MKLRFTPLALENIANVADYLQVRNPTAAQRVRADIYGGLRTSSCFRMSAGSSRLRECASS
jgi:plasmid stabilization system protein ParE